MEIPQRLLLIRGTALVALAVCAALLMTYVQPGSTLCSFDSDCNEVLSSRFSKVAGIPLPVYGMLAFGAIFVCSLSSCPRWQHVMRSLAVIAGVAGLTLLFLLVFVLHRICPYCLVVDGCSLFLAYGAFGWRAAAGTPPLGRMRWWWVGSVVAAPILGAALGAAGSWLPARDVAEVPLEVAAQWMPGKVTLVEVVDFQCPHCRALHLVLMRFLREQDHNLHYVRIVAPMAKHPQARDAARAYLCAQAQGKGEAMAEELFAAEDLTPAGCERLAASFGLGKKAYQTCVAASQTEERIDANVAWVMKACPNGLPCLWVQDQRLSGVLSRDDLNKAVLIAEQRLRASGGWSRRLISN